MSNAMSSNTFIETKTDADRLLHIRLTSGLYHTAILDPPVSLRDDRTIKNLDACIEESLRITADSISSCISKRIPIQGGTSSSFHRKQEPQPADYYGTSSSSEEEEIFSSSATRALNEDDTEKLYAGATWRMYHRIQSSRQKQLSKEGKGAIDGPFAEHYGHYSTGEQAYAGDGGSHALLDTLDQEEGESALGIFELEINS